MALSMYYKLYFDPKATAIWGGTSSGMLDDWYLSAYDMYAHRFTLTDVKRYWLFILELDCIPKLKILRDRLMAKGWGTKHKSGITIGLPPGHALDGFIDPEVQAILEDVKAITGQIEINPHTIDVLSDKLEAQEAKVAKLKEQQDEWHANNPMGKAHDFPAYDTLKQAKSMVVNYKQKLAAADQGICCAPKTHEPSDRKAPMALKARWPDFLVWLKSLPYGSYIRFSKTLNLSNDAVVNWVAYRRVPLEKVMEAAFAKAAEVEWGYIPGKEYTPRRSKPTGAELLQWKSFVAWGKEQLQGFVPHFGKSLGVSTTCVSTWLALKQAHCDPPETGAEKKSRKFSQNLPIPHTAAFCCTGKRPLAGDLRVGLRFWSFFHV
jgi:hypothetical protein